VFNIILPFQDGLLLPKVGTSHDESEQLTATLLVRHRACSPLVKNFTVLPFTVVEQAVPQDCHLAEIVTSYPLGHQSLVMPFHKVLREELRA
jgi:hypothetical protein